MIDHCGWAVPPSHYEKTLAFYLAALAPLGYSEQVTIPGHAVGLGTSKTSVDFWIISSEEKGMVHENGRGVHVAFKSEDHAGVDAFHAAAVKAGGTCNGKPGPRPQYHEGYYGAFVYDPVGNNIEAANRSSGEATKTKTS